MTPTNISRRELIRAAVAAAPFGLTGLRLPQFKPSTPKYFFIYIPNGVVQSNWKTSASREPIYSGSLEPINKVKNDVSVILGLMNHKVKGQVHGQACCRWLATKEADSTYRGAYPIGTSFDQLLASKQPTALGQRTLNLSCNDFQDNHESVYFESISWVDDTDPVPVIKTPEAAFREVFGTPTGPLGDSSLVDALAVEAKEIANKTDYAGKQRIQQYLDNIRQTEKLVAAQRKAIEKIKPVERFSVGRKPEYRGQYLRSMAQIAKHAFETNLTNICTLVIDPERWSTPRVFHELSEHAENHHMLTHDNSETARSKVAEIDRFHVNFFSEVVDAFRKTDYGEAGSLLDECFIIIGSGMGEGYKHTLTELPTIIAGGRNYGAQHGRTIQCDKDTPITNLWNSLGKVSIPDLDPIGDSTGVLDAVFAK